MTTCERFGISCCALELVGLLGKAALLKGHLKVRNAHQTRLIIINFKMTMIISVVIYSSSSSSSSATGVLHLLYGTCCCSFKSYSL